MMTNIHIPPAALEAGAIDLYAEVKGWDRSEAAKFYMHLPPANKAKWDSRARAAFVAMVEAWPKMRKPMRVNGSQSECWIELPLTENPDDKA